MTAWAPMAAWAAADLTEQPAVTNWPARIGLVLLTLALIALALWGMRRGWQARAARQSDVVEPATAPPPGTQLCTPVGGLFLGTSRAGDWLDRIVVFDLGVRSRAHVSWGPSGLWFDRTGARAVFVPAGDIVGLRTDRGVAGTVRAKDSVIVVTWRLGGAVVESGFRADDSSGHDSVLDGLVTTFAPGIERGDSAMTTGES